MVNRRRIRRLIRGLGGPLLFALVVVLLWWGIASSGFFPEEVLASPESVVKAAQDSGGAVLGQVGTTAIELSISLGIAWMGGAAIGTTFGAVRSLRPLVGLARTAYAVPVVIIYPILTVWFGFGSSSKVVFGSFAGIIPMTLMSASAIMTVDPKIRILFRAMGAGRTTLAGKGLLPASLPGVLGAMRISGSLCLVSVVVGEMLVAEHGIGYVIANAANQFDTPLLYLGLCCVAGLAIVMYSIIRVLEVTLSRYGVGRASLLPR